MKFLCSILAEKLMEQMRPADAEKHFEEYRHFTEWLKGSADLSGRIA